MCFYRNLLVNIFYAFFFENTFLNVQDLGSYDSVDEGSGVWGCYAMLTGKLPPKFWKSMMLSSILMVR
jgi:hypothetical protein